MSELPKNLKYIREYNKQGLSGLALRKNLVNCSC